MLLFHVLKTIISNTLYGIHGSQLLSFWLFARQGRIGKHKVCCFWDPRLAQRVLLLQHLQGLHGRQGLHPGGNRESRVPKNVICFLYICIQLVYIFVYIHTLHSVEEMLSFTGWRKHHLPRVRQEEDDGGNWGGMRKNIHLKTVFWRKSYKDESST